MRKEGQFSSAPLAIRAIRASPTRVSGSVSSSRVIHWPRKGGGVGLGLGIGVGVARGTTVASLPQAKNVTDKDTKTAASNAEREINRDTWVTPLQLGIAATCHSRPDPVHANKGARKPALSWQLRVPAPSSGCEAKWEIEATVARLSVRRNPPCVKFRCTTEAPVC